MDTMTEHEAMRTEAVVPIAYHQFFITEEGEAPTGLPATTNGLADLANPNAVVVRTGIHTGPVAVILEARADPPHTDWAWDEIVEVSVTVESGALYVSALMADVDPQPPPLTPTGHCTYRIRIHARGRDLDIDATTDTILETYLLQAWPDDVTPTDILKQTDRYGQMLRGTSLHRETHPEIDARQSSAEENRLKLLRDTLLRQARGE